MPGDCLYWGRAGKIPQNPKFTARAFLALVWGSLDSATSSQATAQDALACDFPWGMLWLIAKGVV
ncbi:hypothetical protein BV372_12135 [Nostoc sp. T09]|nr:hypothetical protein BV372_12135 [Nostoc sp. T09]